jgi:hypothetical protein
LLWLAFLKCRIKLSNFGSHNNGGNQKSFFELEQKETLNGFNESSKIHHVSNTHSSTVWVTYIEGDGGDYVFGVLALYGSIKKQIHNFTDPFILMVFCGDLTESSLLLFRNTSIKVRNHCPDPKMSGKNTFGGQDANWKTLNKLGIFEIKKDFHRLIFVDADIHFLNNPMKLVSETERPGFYAVPSQQSKMRFNSGLFVVVGSFDIEDIQGGLAQMLSCIDRGCDKYVDRMSKEIDDQGFLNVYYANSWMPLSYYYNMKVMFYIKEKIWGQRKIPIKREKVIALHWIGPSKPWNPNIKFPCGNTKKYCFCTYKENLALQYAHNRWEEDLNFILVLQNRTIQAIQNETKQRNLYKELRKKHLEVRAKVCR